MDNLNQAYESDEGEGDFTDSEGDGLEAWGK